MCHVCVAIPSSSYWDEANWRRLCRNLRVPQTEACRYFAAFLLGIPSPQREEVPEEIFLAPRCGRCAKVCSIGWPGWARDDLFGLIWMFHCCPLHSDWATTNLELTQELGNMEELPNQIEQNGTNQTPCPPCKSYSRYQPRIRTASRFLKHSPA